MLSAAADRVEVDPFEALRAREFARLDEQGTVYLDFAASGLHAACQARAHADRLMTQVFGNPHSEHGPSKTSEAAMEAARRAALAHFGADPAQYDICFTANASAAIKLVAESFPFGPSAGLVLTADNHNSVNGIREFAARAGASLTVLPLDAALRLDDPEARLAAAEAPPGLFAFPAQSNFSGVRHPQGLVQAAQALGHAVLIDAAGTGAVASVDLARHPAEFLAFSFYKLFGLPTGLGGLIARRSALQRLRRPWFAGGTVDFVSIEHRRHQLSTGHAGFEDGTPNFLDIAAVADGFAFIQTIDQAALRARLTCLTAYLLQGLAGLRHENGAPAVGIYGPSGLADRGCVVAFNLLNRDGRTVPYQVVEHRAQARRIALRGGCFCNPGAAEAAFGLARHDMTSALDDLAGDFSIPALQERLGPGATVGALRLSLGLPTTHADLDRAVALAASFAD